MKQHNNLLLTSFETQKILHRQPPATDSVKEKQSILKKRIFSEIDLERAAELILKKCTVLAKKAGVYRSCVNELLHTMLFNYLSPKVNLLEQHSEWLRYYDQSLNEIIDDLYDLFNGIDKKSIVFTSEIKINSEDAPKIINKIIVTTIGKYLMERQLLNEREKIFLQEEGENLKNFMQEHADKIFSKQPDHLKRAVLV